MRTLFSKIIRWGFICLTLALALQQEALATASDAHIQFVSTYLQPGTAQPSFNYMPELLNHVSAAHMGPQYFGQVRSTLQGRQAIIDVADEFFDFKKNVGALFPDYQQRAEALSDKYFKGYEQNILAFYIADEPTGYGITRDSLELVIKELKTRFPHIPTYIVYYADCFDNSPTMDAKCGLNGQRGLPADLDWVGFDWYLEGAPANDTANFKKQIIDTTKRLEALTSKRIVVVPDGTDEFLTHYSAKDRETIMTQRLQLSLDFADADKQVIGIDNYAWADHKEIMYDVDTFIRGTRDYPMARDLLFKYSQSVLPKTP